MSVEQVVRCAIIKQWKQLDYRELEDRIEDSERLRSFCRFGDQKVPGFRTLQENIKRISAASWQEILQILVEYAKTQGVDNGKHVRMDCTGVETDIHKPTDSTLMEDVARVLLRIQNVAVKNLGEHAGYCPNRMRAIRKRALRILHAQNFENRKPHYKELIKLTEEVVANSRALYERLMLFESDCYEELQLLNTLKKELRIHIDNGEKIIDVTKRRVLQNEKVPADEKLVSIFEPHTDIIRKSRRTTVFGHKICISAGRSGLVFDCDIAQGNPPDVDLFLPALDRVTDVLGAVPTHLCADDGFSCEKNGDAAKGRGVRQLAFGGKLKSELLRWVTNARVQKKLRCFRAGIEAIISAVKRAFGLDRCTWSGWEGFKQYVLSAIVAWNLQVIARHVLKT